METKPLLSDTPSLVSLISKAAEQKFDGQIISMDFKLDSCILLIKRNDAPLPDFPFMTIKAFTIKEESGTNRIVFEFGHYDLSENDAIRDCAERTKT